MWTRRCPECNREFSCVANCHADDDYEYREIHKDTCLCPECLVNYIKNEPDDKIRKLLIKNLRTLVDGCKRELQFNPSLRELKWKGKDDYEG